LANGFLSKNSKGFTLVELSIVIVIIGLIVAGVVGGQALVRQSKLRSIITDHQKISTAMNAFKLEYNYLPGDIPNATSYWGGGEVSGNGNGFTDYGTEWRHVFRHLGLAEILPGTYAVSEGYTDSFGNYISAGVANNIYGRYYYNMLNFEGDNVLGNPQPGFLLAKEAFSLDVKVDDGDPTRGIFIGLGPVGFAPGCMSAGWGGGPGSANYVLSSNVANCKIIFMCKDASKHCVP